MIFYSASSCSVLTCKSCSSPFSSIVLMVLWMECSDCFSSSSFLLILNFNSSISANFTFIIFKLLKVYSGNNWPIIFFISDKRSSRKLACTFLKSSNSLFTTNAYIPCSNCIKRFDVSSRSDIYKSRIFYLSVLWLILANNSLLRMWFCIWALSKSCFRVLAISRVSLLSFLNRS